MAINEINKGKMVFSRLRWLLIVFFFIFIIFTAFNNSITIVNEFDPIILAILIFAIAVFHGIERYGLKNMTIFFIITWIVSNFFEALSIRTGFPFSFYHYVNLPGPRIFDVPVIIMFAYFGMGYASWTLSHVLTGQYSKRLEGKQIFIVPFVGAFIMVMWDLIMDPAYSTLQSIWVWQNPGPYFGVPLMNFAGWFLVVFIFFQIFAFYIFKYDKIGQNKSTILSSKLFWIEMVATYAIVALNAILKPVLYYNDINLAMALITVFTMVFVVMMSLITIMNNQNLRQ